MTWIFATVVWSLLAAVWAFDAIRLRRRLAALAVLAPSNEPPSPQHRFLCAPGVVLDEATRRTSPRYACRQFIAYFQSATNTYAPVPQLRAVYEQALAHPQIVGLAIGTR